MEKSRIIICAIAIISFLAIIFYGISVNTTNYVTETIFFIIFTLILIYLFNYLKLDNFTYSILILAMLLHSLGTFGFYAKTPIIIQYDHITHFILTFAFAVPLFKLLKGKITGRHHKRTIIIIVLFFCLGVGALIEQIEFLGYLNSDGARTFFYVGDAGDTGVGGFTQIELKEIDAVGGGWLNTMWDLMYNFLGAVMGIIVALIFYNKNYLLS
ncbi:MAG TPA: DUF2238 domain-containing protein [Candidatus Nanoarchaeia archaeon]|nr:DUF2238 domain-containing protein [Candidatus Nanoarchaeia archaeon]